MTNKLIKLPKVLVIVVIIILLFLSSFIVSNALGMNITTSTINNNVLINPTTNFFGQVEDKRTVELLSASDANDLLVHEGYEKVCENESLSLYLLRDYLGIAIYDKNASYLWYSMYHEEGAVLDPLMASGVSIVCYDALTLIKSPSIYCGTKDCKIEYQIKSNGFVATLNFVTSGITFDISVTINGCDLVTNVLLDTLVEVPYKKPGKKNATEYKLQSVTLFPYFGADNYRINGYSFIPDGSGALIRYTDQVYDTAFVKRIYGDDYGLKNIIESDYLKGINNVTLPVFGVNHGYNQAAFVAKLDKGYGSSELHSYPNGYSNNNINTTFFTYITREHINIPVNSSDASSISIINKDVYSNNYQTTYSFLNNNEANYSGMAKKYAQSFNFKETDLAPRIKLDTIGMDYKNGLFGKKYIKMTSYNQLASIIKDYHSLVLSDESLNYIDSLTINYKGYNKGGYFDNALGKVTTSSVLGSKKDFKSLLDVVTHNNDSISFYSNPGIANIDSIGKKTIKKHSLESFVYDYKSSLKLKAKIINPLSIYDYFAKNEKFYKKYDMTNHTLEMIGNNAFSYRYKSSDYTREEMINNLQSELSLFNDYNINLITPNDYTFNYLDSYYDSNYESSKYAFITDSIPFISLLLSGEVLMYAPNFNYINNKDLFMLRMVEYNLLPSFVITKEDTNNLRYTNYEYLFSTKYDKWVSDILKVSSYIYNAKTSTSSSRIVSHSYIDSGIAKVVYDNNNVIYCNYTSSNYTVNGKVIPSMNYIVVSE